MNLQHQEGQNDHNGPSKMEEFKNNLSAAWHTSEMNPSFDKENSS